MQSKFKYIYINFNNYFDFSKNHLKFFNLFSNLQTKVIINDFSKNINILDNKNLKNTEVIFLKDLHNFQIEDCKETLVITTDLNEFSQLENYFKNSKILYYYSHDELTYEGKLIFQNLHDYEYDYILLPEYIDQKFFAEEYSIDPDEIYKIENFNKQNINVALNKMYNYARCLKFRQIYFENPNLKTFGGAQASILVFAEFLKKTYFVNINLIVKQKEYPENTEFIQRINNVFDDYYYLDDESAVQRLIKKPKKKALFISFTAGMTYLESIQKYILPNAKTLFGYRGDINDNLLNTNLFGKSEEFLNIQFNALKNTKYDKYAVMHPKMIKYIEKHFGVPVDKFIVIGTFLEKPKITKINYRKRYNNNNIAIISRVDPIKNIDSVIMIAQALPNYTFNIYGDITYPDYYEKLQKQVSKRNLSNVLFHGFSKDVENEIKNSFLSLLTSLSEGIPRAALDSKSQKLPMIILNNFTTAEDLVTDQSFLVDSIEEAILQIQNIRSKSLAEYIKISENESKAIDKYLLNEKSKKHYQNLLNSL